MLWLYLALSTVFLTIPAEAQEPWRPPPELVSFVASRIPDKAPAIVRLRLLHQALISSRGLGIRQTSEWSGTSTEVWQQRRADCVGFAYLFGGLARALSIEVSFAVEDLSNDLRTRPVVGNLRMKEAHVLIFYRSRRGESWAIDHGGFRRQVRGLQHLRDVEAAALLWSNRGARAMLAGECAEARRQTGRALVFAPRLGAIQRNFEVISSRCRTRI